MARVQIYNEHSSIVPVLFATYDPQWKPCLDDIKIKEEPVDSDAGDDEHLEHDGSGGEATITENLQTTNHADTEVATSNTIITSKENSTAEGSSSVCLNIDKSHVDDAGVSSYGSKRKTRNAIANQNHVESDVNVRNTRYRTRTISSVIECDICHVTFPGETVLKAHKNYYARGELICHLCKKHFSIPIHLTSHRRSAHRGDNWTNFKFECNYCKLGFVKKQYLQQHIFHHHNVNKILDSKKFRRRMKSRNAMLEKILIDSKLRDHQPVKRKHNDTVMVGPLGKKIAMRTSHEEIGPLSNDRIDEAHQSCPNKIVEGVNVISNSSIQPPLVKICAIPHEVEALLNDSESSTDDSSTDSDASDTFSDSELSDATCYRPTKKYSLRSSSRLANPPTPNRSTQRKWAILKKRYNCQSCQVRVERLSSPLSNEYGSTNDVSDAGQSEENETIQINSMPTVGMELKNLEWALKKLQVVNQGQEIHTEEKPNMVEDSQQSCESTNAVSLPSQDIPVENSSATRMLYMSSICQTRYTTKKKLVFHYLCFHTNPQYQECAVCRSRYADISELKEHLIQHCIEIPESPQEKSPINPEGSCENSKEKYVCRGCKKKFWLVSYLRDHEQHCEMQCKPQETDSSNNQQNDDELKSDDSPKSILRMQLVQSSGRDDSTSQTIQKTNGRAPMSLDCTVCHTTFKNVTKYLEHKRKYVPSINKYPCYRCGTPFPSRSILGAHTRSAHERESAFEFVCIICNQGFREKSSLRQHMLHIHSDEMKDHPPNVLPRTEWTHERTCSVCKLIFPDRKCYIEHSMHYYDDDVIKCSTCHETFSSHHKALRHKKKVHYTEEMKKEQIYYCALCNEGFIHPIDIYSHTYHIHNTAIPIEKYVSMSEDKQESNRHGLLHTCRICDAKFSTAVLLSDHQSEYSDTGNHCCSYCPRRCKTGPLLEKHIKLSHSNPRRNEYIKCNSCDEILASKASWNCHMKHIHLSSDSDGRSSKVHTDEAYSKEYGVEKIAVSETENNSDPRTPHPIGIEYTCALCDEQFMNSTDLKIHSLKYGNACIHNTAEVVNTNFSIASIYSVKPEDYEKLCNAEDGGTNSIKIDQQNNISETIDEVRETNALDDALKVSVDSELNRPNSITTCQICKTNFPTRNSLTKHERLYSNTGDHECVYCHRKFKSIIHLQNHIRKHESRKFETYIPPHYCKTCDEKFASEASKIVHFAHIHRELLRRQPQASDCNERRHSTRQQSKSLHQTNLDSFIRRDPESEKSKESYETICTSGIDLSKEMLPFIKLGIDRRVDSNSIPVLEPARIILNNIQINRPVMIENAQKNSNTLSENTYNNSINETANNTSEKEDLEEEVVEVPQKVIEREKQTVVAGQETEILVEEEEINEVNVPTSVNTSQALCDICGDVFTNRNGLANHQKKTHDIDMNIDTLSDTQEEYIDIELISDDEVQYETPSTNYNKTDLDIIFDSNCMRSYSETCTNTRPLKPLKTNTKKNQLTCRICYSLFSSLNSLVKHLEEVHPTDSPEKIDNIQNPRVSSSSKIYSQEERTNFRLVQLCCEFCEKQFVNDQYLDAHIRKAHEDDVIAARLKNSATLQNSNLLVKNFDETDNIQNNLQNNKYTHPKLSRMTIVKTADVIKKIDNNLLLGNKPKLVIDFPQNSININSTRCRRIPITKLYRTIHNTPILPKPPSIQNNDVSL